MMATPLLDKLEAVHGAIDSPTLAETMDATIMASHEFITFVSAICSQRDGESLNSRENIEFGLRISEPFRDRLMIAEQGGYAEPQMGLMFACHALLSHYHAYASAHAGSGKYAPDDTLLLIEGEQLLMSAADAINDCHEFLKAFGVKCGEPV
jgi:hypothetical protein